MKRRTGLLSTIPTLGLVICAAAIGASTGVGLGASVHLVSQKGRTFTPGEMTIGRGDSIELVNDDGDLRHHAYIDSDSFSFDSGDQEPGARVSIRFATPGKYDVLCAIHPKMKLVVQVK